MARQVKMVDDIRVCARFVCTCENVNQQKPISLPLPPAPRCVSQKPGVPGGLNPPAEGVGGPGEGNTRRRRFPTTGEHGTIEP